MISVIELAEHLLFVRELSNKNDGAWVEAILRVVGCKKGDPWCAAFVSFVLKIANAGVSPLVMTASCQAIYDYAKKHDLIVDEPQPGYVFLLLDANGHAHHTGFCRDVAVNKVFPTIEGNTNPAGGREGYGVFKRKRTLGKSIVIVKTH